MIIRKRIDLQGIVQGVGFRPYVFRLATERKLAGVISNTSSGVTVEVEGSSEVIDEFVARLPQEPPPLARIIQLDVTVIPCRGESDFRILPSRRDEHVQTLISADVATCADCLSELFDPADRRYGYPFINCTNCGPRFTIVRDIPYDRPYTSMAEFRMCAECQREYDDPLNRRFHAQPNACWRCGPQLELLDKNGIRIEGADPLSATAELIAAGRVAAVKGLGGFHLAADATNAEAVRRLRERKHRVEKPFAVMVPDMAAAEVFCEIDSISRQLLTSVQRPIVLLPWKRPSAIAAEVAPGNSYLGLFLPYTPLHHLLFAKTGARALVMTSANLSEEPIVIGNEEAVERLKELADCLLVHNREILLRCDDSVMRVSDGRPRQLRRSRGFVPVPVFLHRAMPSILAVGGELKNTICITKGKHAFLSQHIGDLENFESYRFFEEAIAHLRKILEIEPAIVAYDLHPDYFCTRWALQQQGMELVGVQHHHAHIASCMAEHHLEGSVIGFALDGTGYGTDGRIWGGEVMVAGYEDFRRVAHFDYVKLPGGAAAIREPWRMAVSYLAHHFGPECAGIDRAFLRGLDPHKLKLLLNMMKRDVNSPLTSSCGRLFDAVAALTGVRQTVNYEAQAAIELENAITEPVGEEAYELKVTPGAADPWIIDTKPLFSELLDDLRCQTPVSAISAKFHLGLVDVFARIAQHIRDRERLNRVCLSGGTFQNRFLSERLQQRLAGLSFEVFAHSEVPAGDGGLSLGQALVAAHRPR
ncbi:MAG: carbamoyltransferase HypF [Candidatus Korobacteraceae bacterium]|jgi:hydrogenase maturation protein HypF